MRALHADCTYAIVVPSVPTAPIYLWSRAPPSERAPAPGSTAALCAARKVNRVLSLCHVSMRCSDFGLSAERV